MTIIDFGLRIAGVPSQTIEEIEKAAPAAAELLRLFKQAEPLIRQAQPLMDRLMPILKDGQPLVAQALPLLTPILKEVDALMPAVQDVLKFIQQQKAATISDT